MLTLTKDSFDSILRWAKKYPDLEVTGFIASGPSGQRIVPMRNVAPQPATRYEWDTREMARRWQDMDDRGEEALAFYHSHPNGRPDPSEADMAGALNIGIHYLIAYPWMRSAEEPVLPGEPTEPVWRMNAWECSDYGILVATDMEVLP